VTRCTPAAYRGRHKTGEAMVARGLALSVVVSGGGSALTRAGRSPTSPAVPARVSPPKKHRLVQPSACGMRIGTSSLLMTVRMSMLARV
jgi:hypothetical protein